MARMKNTFRGGRGRGKTIASFPTRRGGGGGQGRGKGGKAGRERRRF